MISKFTALAAAGMCSLALVAMPVMAATNYVAKQSAGEISSSSIIGTKVKNDAGESIGDVNYVVLNSQGMITTAVIGVGGFLGIGEKDVGVPFAALKAGTEDGKAIYLINATKEELKAAPSYVWSKPE